MHTMTGSISAAAAQATHSCMLPASKPSESTANAHVTPINHSEGRNMRRTKLRIYTRLIAGTTESPDASRPPASLGRHAAACTRLNIAGCNAP